MVGLHQRFNKALLLTIMLAMLPIVHGCSQPQVDPKKNHTH